MEKVMSILQEIRPDVDFVNEKLLIDDGILDSFDIIAIVNELSVAFDVEIDAAELVPENFNTVEAMLELIQNLQKEA